MNKFFSKLDIFIIKLTVISIMAFILGVFGAFVEMKLGVNINYFCNFTMGYISCLVLDWKVTINDKLV